MLTRLQADLKTARLAKDTARTHAMRAVVSRSKRATHREK